jgi:DNA-binding NarL/FixJ family response regulator
MPDLIVLNLWMPVVHGLETIREIAKSAPGAKFSYSVKMKQMNYGEKLFAAGRMATSVSLALLPTLSTKSRDS